MDNTYQPIIIDKTFQNYKIFKYDPQISEVKGYLVEFKLQDAHIGQNITNFIKSQYNNNITLRK